MFVYSEYEYTKDTLLCILIMIDKKHVMVLGQDVDLETSSLVSELNIAIVFVSFKNAIALFSSEMSEDQRFQVNISSQNHDVRVAI